MKNSTPFLPSKKIAVLAWAVAVGVALVAPASVYARWAQAPGTASCSSGTGFIQAIKGIVGDDIISFKKLSLDDGDYVEMEPAVSLDLAALGFAGSGGTPF